MVWRMAATAGISAPPAERRARRWRGGGRPEDRRAARGGGLARPRTFLSSTCIHDVLARGRRVGTSAAVVRGCAAAVDRDLTRAEIDELTSTLSLDELCAAAAAVRAAGPDPTLVTFSPKVFVPLTKACRDQCGYCTFAEDPSEGHRVFMTVEEVVAVAEAGRVKGATECLFTLGDRPEARYPEARDELRALGVASTVDYLARCASEVLKRTGLLPHCNAGVLSVEELRKLREVSASQGLMLETTSSRLTAPGGAHEGCDSKRPEVRLRCIDNAGVARVPFTSGILIGIGETREERLDALFAIRDSDRAHGGHVQEVIVQNFRAKVNTRMADAPEPSMDELLWTAAVARLIFGPEMAVQVPPNLTPEPDDTPRGTGGATSERDGWRRLLRAGVSDWGGVSPGVTPDFVSPEAPWPHLSELAAVTAEEGYSLVPRLAAQPRYVTGKGALDEWIDPGVAPHVRVLMDAEGLSRGTRWCPGREEAAAELERAEAEASSSPSSTSSSKNAATWTRARFPAAADVVGVDGVVTGPRAGVEKTKLGGTRSHRLGPSREVAAAISRLAARGAEVASDPSSSAAMTSAGDVHDEDAVRDAAAIAALLRARGTDFDAVW